MSHVAGSFSRCVVEQTHVEVLGLSGPLGSLLHRVRRYQPQAGPGRGT
ncbi:MAG: hypothetical protein R6X14_03580 [bacterium]